MIREWIQRLPEDGKSLQVVNVLLSVIAPCTSATSALNHFVSGISRFQIPRHLRL